MGIFIRTGRRGSMGKELDTLWGPAREPIIFVLTATILMNPNSNP
jgi:hypothetical protein